MKIDHLKIAGKSYTVTFTDEPVKKDFGMMESASQAIVVYSGMHPEAEKDTLMHEVIHAIECQLGLSLKEAEVAALGCMLVATLWDNPEFAKYIIKRP